MPGANGKSLKELAGISGFSLSSVSRALDPSRAHLVKEESRLKIQSFARQYGFSINPAARRLRSAHTEIISVLAYAPRSDRPFGHEFTSLNSRALATVERRISEYNYEMKLHMIGDALPGPEFIDPRRTDGVLFISYHGDEYTEALDRAGIPGIFASNYIDPARRDVTSVTLDWSTGHRKAVDFLMRSGVRRIAYAGPEFMTIPPRLRRALKVETALRERGMYEPENFFVVENYYDIRDLVSRWQPEMFDALFCSNDVIADWFVREFRYHGIDVPGRVRIIGHDNDTLYHRGDSGIASIGLEPETMFQGAVDLLMEMVRSGKCEKGCRRIYETDFFIRESCL